MIKILRILEARLKFIKVDSVSFEIEKILVTYKNHSEFYINNSSLDLYGGGEASQKIIQELLTYE